MRVVDSIGLTRGGDKVHKGVTSSYYSGRHALCNGSYKLKHIFINNFTDDLDVDNDRELIYELIKHKIFVDALCCQCFEFPFRTKFGLFMKAVNDYYK